MNNLSLSSSLASHPNALVTLGKDNTLRVSSSLKDRVVSWVKNTFSSRSTLMAKNQKICQAVTQDLLKSGQREWSVKSFLSTQSALERCKKPLRARNIQYLIAEFRSLDSSKPKGGGLISPTPANKPNIKPSAFLEYLLPDAKSQKALQTLREQGLPFYGLGDIKEYLHLPANTSNAELALHLRNTLNTSQDKAETILSDYQDILEATAVDLDQADDDALQSLNPSMESVALDKADDDDSRSLNPSMKSLNLDKDKADDYALQSLDRSMTALKKQNVLQQATHDLCAALLRKLETQQLQNEGDIPADFSHEQLQGLTKKLQSLKAEKAAIEAKKSQMNGLLSNAYQKQETNMLSLINLKNSGIGEGEGTIATMQREFLQNKQKDLDSLGQTIQRSEVFLQNLEKKLEEKGEAIQTLESQLDEQEPPSLKEKKQEFMAFKETLPQEAKDALETLEEAFGTNFRTKDDVHGAMGLPTSSFLKQLTNYTKQLAHTQKTLEDLAYKVASFKTKNGYLKDHFQKTVLATLAQHHRSITEALESTKSEHLNAEKQQKAILTLEKTLFALEIQPELKALVEEYDDTEKALDEFDRMADEALRMGPTIDVEEMVMDKALEEYNRMNEEYNRMKEESLRMGPMDKALEEFERMADEALRMGPIIDVQEMVKDIPSE